MGRFIVKLRDRYFEWSTSVDAPVTYGMTADELREHIRDEYGNQGLRELPERLARVERTGCSAHDGRTAASVIRFNRAGDGETTLTEAQLWAAYAYPPNNMLSKSEG